MKTKTSTQRQIISRFDEMYLLKKSTKEDASRRERSEAVLIEDWRPPWVSEGVYVQRNRSFLSPTISTPNIKSRAIKHALLGFYELAECLLA